MTLAQDFPSIHKKTCIYENNILKPTFLIIQISAGLQEVFSLINKQQRTMQKSILSSSTFFNN